MPTVPLQEHLSEPVNIPIDGFSLPGILTEAPERRGVVLFVHGSGSSRLSPRNQEVAQALVRAGFTSLLFDLLTPDEGESRARVFDVGLLARRLEAATSWVQLHPSTAALRIGYFGASTGAAAALVAAAGLGPGIGAVVSRGGRPDLAGTALRRVVAPTLLLVGGLDGPVIDLNAAALREIAAPHEMIIVPNATHLFEEPGALEEVSRLAVDWFRRFLCQPLRTSRAAPAVAAR